MQLNPKKIVEELGKYVIGQSDAKKVIAIAFRNRYRRMMIKDDILRDDIVPKNVLMIGPTGVGKTEIVRRASQICDFPYIKVEASRFTEIGYVGKDVEGIIRDLVEQTVAKYRQKEKKAVYDKAKYKAENTIISKLFHEKQEDGKLTEGIKETMRSQLQSGLLDKENITIDIKNEPNSPFHEIELPGQMQGIVQVGMLSLGDVFKSDKNKKIRTTVKEALEILTNDNSETLINEKEVVKSAVNNVQQNGVVFIDEIDKLISSKDASSRGEVSREGVQRDLLPIIEGSAVHTKYGYVNTRHILFIGCGAFYNVKPTDLMPELQGRFPVQTKLKLLTRQDFVDILSKTQNNLPMQYSELLQIDGIKIEFTISSVEKIASIAYDLNTTSDNTGARRLHTIIEKVVEDFAFEYPKSTKSKKIDKFIIDSEYVENKLEKMLKQKSEKAKFVI